MPRGIFAVDPDQVGDPYELVNSYEDILALPKLRHREEVHLAEQIQAGIAANERLHDPTSSTGNPAWDLELPILTAQVEAGQTAHTRLWMHNFRIVDRMSRRRESSCGPTLELADLHQVGLLRLMRAATEYQPSNSVKFTLYAQPRVRQSIDRAVIFNGYAMKLATYIGESLSDLLDTYDEMLLELKREPTVAELSKKIGVPESDIQTFLALQQVVSSDSQEARGIGGEVDIDEELAERIVAGKVRILLDELKPGERKVLCLRYGIGCQVYNRAEIGRMMGITREMVRQLEGKALSRLRHPARYARIYHNLF